MAVTSERRWRGYRNGTGLMGVMIPEG